MEGKLGRVKSSSFIASRRGVVAMCPFGYLARQFTVKALATWKSCNEDGSTDSFKTIGSELTRAVWQASELSVQENTKYFSETHNILNILTEPQGKNHHHHHHHDSSVNTSITNASIKNRTN